ncbi:Mitogen-activated protein kinase kinase kinase kinase 2 [Fragariocoptes setiger]|uniref:Mitogen-activated protein kinase kinase kinase kinase n=1 Tax=Fragariocoptes setiger TaxID=1670756 RepID=A0ABQ7SBS1_9ACAR|nr:Mitogen-activated protein kinase kinase kinase kinase 2 [Fragariocoptes setiger]
MDQHPEPVAHHSSNHQQSIDINTLSDPSGVFELLDIIGSGTYGDVYKARHVKTDQIAAVKIIKLDPGENFQVIQQEILMMKSCRHPNIVAFYGSYFRKDRLWICMEYCGGGSLQDIYHVTGPLSEPQIALVCRETLKGLHYLHALGKMHRDIKGANILLTTIGEVKLADFGVAAQVTATIRKRKSFIGSPYWMAPEVAAVETKGGYNQQCDVWSVGITAIELAELQPPMFDLHPMRALFLMSKSNFKPPTLKDKNRWSKEYRSFVESALTCNPKKRPSAEKLLEHPFVLPHLPRQLMRDLLERAQNPHTNFSHFQIEPDPEEEKMLMDIPRRITSSKNDAAHDIVQTCLDQDDESEADKPPQAPPRRRRPVTTVGFPSAESNFKQPQQRYSHVPSEKQAAHKFQKPKVPPPPAPVSSRPIANGLPPTPKVHMGACFSKVFNECPLAINCAVSWVHPETHDQHILLGCNEGIYTFNLNELHDACMDVLFPRKTTWMFVIKDVLMSLSGQTAHLFRHDLVSLHNNSNKGRFGLPMDSMINKIPDKLVPRKFNASTKISDTRGCVACCIGRNPFNGFKYLCGAVPTGIFLMQWYNPMNKFMLLKHLELQIPSSLPLFSMIISPDYEYPLLCVGVRRRSDLQSSLKLDLINLNSSADWFDDEDLSDTIKSDQNLYNLINVTQLDKDTILVCHDKVVELVDLNGTRKSNKKSPSLLRFEFSIESIVCLSDSVLAFHKHGMQGRSFKTNEIVQEINDPSRVYNVVGNDNVVVLESRPTEVPESPSNLYILTGHENTL